MDRNKRTVSRSQALVFIDEAIVVAVHLIEDRLGLGSLGSLGPIGARKKPKAGYLSDLT